MSVYAFIFARGGSKGVPGKNIKDLCGKPLLAYSIEMANSINTIEKVFVSTDDHEIAAVARDLSAEVIDRPVGLSQDDSPEWFAWQHAVEYVRNKYGDFDLFVSLPVTAPLRSKDDVELCIATLSSDVDIVVTATESTNNPFFNMLSVDETGFAHLFNKSDVIYTRRQDVPKAYNMTTVSYVMRPDYIMSVSGLFDGSVKFVEIPEERAIDIDTIFDFEIASYLMNKRIEDSK